KAYWAWLCSFCGRPVGPLLVVRPDIEKRERRREARRQHAAYSRRAWERQRRPIVALEGAHAALRPFLPGLSACCGNLGQRRGRHPQTVIARRHGCLLACGEGAERRLDPRPGRVAMDMGEERLHPRNERLAVEQLADGDRGIERSRIAAAPYPRAQVGVEI